MRMITRYNPKAGLADFWHEFRRPNPYRWPILAVSGCLTFSLLWMVAQEDVIGPPVPPEVTYVTSFAEGRTDAEIAASNAANQDMQDELTAAAERRAERQKDMYRALGRATGIDVDKMEREIAVEQAEEAAAARARRNAAEAAIAASRVNGERDGSAQ